MSYVSMSPGSIAALDNFDRSFVEAVTGAFDFDMNGLLKLHRGSDVGDFTPDEKQLPDIFNQIDSIVSSYLAEFDPTKDFCDTNPEERKMLDGVLKVGRLKDLEVPVYIFVQKTTAVDRVPCFYGYFLGARVSRFIMKDGRWLVRTKTNTYVLDSVVINGTPGRIVTYRRAAQPLMIPPLKDASFDIVPTEAMLMREIFSSLVRDETFLHDASIELRKSFWTNTALNNSYKLSQKQQDEFCRLRRIIKSILETYNALTTDSVSHCHPTLLEEIVSLLEQTRR